MTREEREIARALETWAALRGDRIATEHGEATIGHDILGVTVQIGDRLYRLRVDLERVA